MATQHSLWTHGSAVTVESPENLIRSGYFSWGAEMVIKQGGSCWFHIALSLPKLPYANTILLLRTYLFFNAFNCSIRNIHVYDGPAKVQEYNDVCLENEHRLAKDHSNTFNLSKNHVVEKGIRFSLFCVASTDFGSGIPASRLIISTARADYVTGNNFTSDVFSDKHPELKIIEQ